MGRFIEKIQKISNVFHVEHPPVGTVVGLPPKIGPRSTIVNIIEHGVGDCASVYELEKYSGFPATVTDKYIDPMVAIGVLERRPSALPQTGEIVDLICLTEEGKRLD